MNSDWRHLIENGGSIRLTRKKMHKLLCSRFKSSMDPLETFEFVQKPTIKNTKRDDQNHLPSRTTSSSTTSKLLSILQEPSQWIQMLSSQLDPTFILGIFLVYGLNLGFNGSFFRVVTDYYWKDVQKVQPSAVQLYMGLYYIPWIMKPIWGLLTDVFPIRGYRRRPYFVVGGILGCVSALMVAFLGKIPVAVALSCLIGVATGMAIADVTIDACIAGKSIEFRSLAADMQSLCGYCSSFGALIGYSISGAFVHRLGPQVALVFLAIPPALVICLGFVIHEKRSDRLPSKKKKAVEDLGIAVKSMYQTIKYPQVWKPSLYIYLSLALSFSTHEGQFYWYTDPKAGPAFSQEFVGIIYAMGAVASILGVLIYQKRLRDYPFRKILFCAQLLYGLTGMLDLIFVLRWNLFLRIPDYFFVITEQCMSHIISRIRWMPMMVLSTRLCPLGIEGTFFALLMCFDSLGSLSSKFAGGIVLHALHVTRADFTNLWLVILVRNMLRFGTLAFIFLIPNGEQTDELITVDILENNFLVASEADDDVGVRLVSMNEKIQEQV